MVLPNLHRVARRFAPFSGHRQPVFAAYFAQRHDEYRQRHHLRGANAIAGALSRMPSLRTSPLRTVACSSTSATRINWFEALRPPLHPLRPPTAGSSHATSQPGPTATCRRAPRSLPHLGQPVPASLRLVRRRGEHRAGGLSNKRTVPSGMPDLELKLEHRSRAWSMTCRDDVPRSPTPPGRAGRPPRRRSAGSRTVATHPQFDREAPGLSLVKNADISIADGSGDSTAASSSLRSSAAVRRSSCRWRGVWAASLTISAWSISLLTVHTTLSVLTAAFRAAHIEPRTWLPTMTTSRSPTR
jgi:hypothetical protein